MASLNPFVHPKDLRRRAQGEILAHDRVTVWCGRGFFHYDPSCPISLVALILLPLWDSSCSREPVQAINTCDYDLSTSGRYSKRSKRLLDLISVRFGLCIVPDFVIRIWYIIITDEEEKGFIVSRKIFVFLRWYEYVV
ncbi:hypothetical protein TRIUR3_28738 [Triticum urartu]|uniref:Uncharacterized protein n=1 Tax=Triticum urartu TaxID=4572 RepID=M8A6D1_TRIUA|nr:hypothetical protein TRIUR3_28738 [Triticum urartu]